MSDLGLYQARHEVSKGKYLVFSCRDKLLAKHTAQEFGPRFAQMLKALPNPGDPAQTDLVALDCEYQRILKREAAEQEWYDFEVIDGQRKPLYNEDGTPKLCPIEVMVIR